MRQRSGAAASNPKRVATTASLSGQPSRMALFAAGTYFVTNVIELLKEYLEEAAATTLSPFFSNL
jgi:hypothetical protein